MPTYEIVNEYFGVIQTVGSDDDYTAFSEALKRTPPNCFIRNKHTRYGYGPAQIEFLQKVINAKS